MGNNKITAADIQHVYLFQALNDEQMQHMLGSAHLEKLPAKTVLFEVQKPADRFYLLKSGQVKLFRLSANGDEKVIEIVQPDQTFAEAIMFLQKQIYPVSAETIVDSEIYSFDMKVFRKILEESRETCFRLMAGMSRRLHARIDEIDNLTLHNATYRLVVYLLEQLPQGAVELSSIHLSTPKSVIASNLSIQPETFSRILTKLTKQGLIQVDGNDITLHDVNGLRQLL